jgi:2-haloacid dehalogenase
MDEPQTIGFDIYGTLVDPLAIASVLQTYAGNQASRFAELWREKQVEYAFRRGLMRNYEPFDVCTRDVPNPAVCGWSPPIPGTLSAPSRQG